MKNIFSSWIVVPLLILIFFVDDSISWGSSNDFIVHQKISLTQKSDGFDGVLEILRDSRVTDSDIKLMQMHDPDLDLSKKSKFKSTPLKSAVVRLASRNGQVIQSLNLENPYASLESITTVEPGKRTLLLTEDFGIGMGSYSGPITRILAITSRSIKWATAKNQKTGEEIQISLMRSLKTAWNFAPSVNGSGKDILKVSCRPDEAVTKFITTFSRYHRDKHGWTFATRTENLMWEADDSDQGLGYSLPEFKMFP